MRMLPCIAGVIAPLTFIASAQTLPSTLPSTQPTTDPIIEIRLEDPVTPESHCYLDLDTGKTYPRGTTQADIVAARQFIREHGIDLMCESREPVRGLVAYDMSTQQETADVHRPPMFATLRRIFEKAEPKAFDFVDTRQRVAEIVSVSDARRCGGVLEIVAFEESPSGVRLRYQLVPEPLPQRLVNTAEINRLRAIIAALEVHLVQLRRAYSAMMRASGTRKTGLQQVRDF